MKRRKKSTVKARATRLRLYLERRLNEPMLSASEERRVKKHLAKVHKFPTATHWSDA